MRIPVSILVLCAAITGCTPSIDPALVEVVSINSNPQGAAVRLNGVASGRTPTEVSLDRSADYKLEVGKGGYEGEVRYLKPSLQNTKDGLSYGFGGKPIVVTLTKLPGADDAAVPEGDSDEFKKLKNATNGEDPGAPGTVKANIAAVQDATAKVKQALAKQEADAAQKVAGLQKLLDQAKAAAAAENADAKATAQASEAEVAIAAAIADAAAEKAKGAATLEALEARRQALLNKVEAGASQDAAKAIEAAKADIAKSLAAADAKVAAAQAALDKAEQGKNLFAAKSCVMCHNVGGHFGAGAFGPDLTHLASRKSLAGAWLDNRDLQKQRALEQQTQNTESSVEVDRATFKANLIKWIGSSGISAGADGKPTKDVKPGNRMHYYKMFNVAGLRETHQTLTADELDALAEYLLTLK